MKTRSLARATRVLAASSALASAAALSTLVGAPATADVPPELHRFRVQCQAGDGLFGIGFGGSYRCQDAKTDGMNVFWAERTICENAGRLFFESFQESGERGSWSCAPSSWTPIRPTAG